MILGNVAATGVSLFAINQPRNSLCKVIFLQSVQKLVAPKHCFEEFSCISIGRDGHLTNQSTGRGPECLKFPKWLGEGAQGTLGQRNREKEKPPVLARNGVALVQNQALDGAKDSWETCAIWVQHAFCTSPNHFPEFLTSKPSPRHFGFRPWVESPRETLRIRLSNRGLAA